MAGYNDPESGYTAGGAGFFTHLGHVTDITNKFDKDATPTSGQILAWNGSVYAPASPSGATYGGITIPVAATDSLADDKVAAGSRVCDGTADQTEIQAAIDLGMTQPFGGATVKLLPGTYTASATVSLGHPTDSAGTYRVELYFEQGAKLLFPTVGATTPIIKIESSDCSVRNPWIQGSGSKGNGIGICFGGDTTNYGGRWTKTVYRSQVVKPFITNCNYGICFAVDKTPVTGTSSSGDNNVFNGGFITNCKEGINSAGFVNRVYSTTIAGCNYSLHGTSDRNSHKIECYGVTWNNWATACIWLEKDHGSLFDGIWMEHTAAQSSVPTQALLFGNTTSSAYVAANTRFAGNTFLTLQDEQYAARFIRADNVVFDNLVMSTDGNMPTSTIFRQDSNHAGIVQVNRLCWMTGVVPATWNYATKTLSKDAAATGKVVIKAVPGPAGAAKNTTYGDTTPTPTEATYYIDKAGSPNSGIYWAKDRTGHIAYFAADTATTSGLKAVLEALAANDVHFRFGSGRYHFLDAPSGVESWAGAQDHAVFGTTTPPIKGLSFSAAGMYSTIISNRSNYAGATDTEPLSFTNCQYVTMRDFAVESCGTYKSTTDAIDFDQGAHIRIERVRITRSRARGIVIDGGDLGKWAKKNIVRDSIFQGRPDQPGLGLVSGGTLTASTAYRYIVSWTDSDLAGAQTAGETKPSDESVITTDATNKSVRVDLPIGPYTVTERKVYRAPVGSGSWVRVATITDNTTTTYTDAGGGGTGVTMPVSHRSTIFDSALEFLGCSHSKAKDNTIDGPGDATSGLNPHGINFARKSTVPTPSNYNKATGNTVRQCAGNGIRMVGGIGNSIKDNDVSNSGTVSVRAANIRLEGATSISTLRNEIRGNTCFDDQDANSWSTGLTVNNQIQISATGTPTNTIVNGNILTPGSSSSAILDSGTDSVVWDNYGHNTEYALAEYGDPQSGNFTVTQAMSNQTIPITGLATVTLPVLKKGTIVWFIRDTASAVTFATSGTTLDKPATNSASPRAQTSKVCFEWMTTTRVLESGDMG